jgi:hypothetical protein
MLLKALKWLGWRGGAAVAIALALALTLWSRASWKEEAGKWKETAGIWRTAFDTQKSAYQSAQAAARAKAEAQKAKDEVRYRELAERADHADQQIANLRAASQRYAQSNSLRNVKARIASGAGGRSGAAGESGAASGSNRSGADTDVVVPRADFDKLVDNTIRLKQVNEWGQSLIADGKAVALEENR